jgi:L-alanine-DL-glutamate epimerase-like enolase superfamily enzyme
VVHEFLREARRRTSDLVAGQDLLSLRLRKAEVWLIDSPAPPSHDFYPGLGHLRHEARVRAAVLTVSDENSRGSWGPLPHDLAQDARNLVCRLAGKTMSDPGEIGRLARQLDRHAHTGRGCAASGAAELACWDLLGQRHEVPVWQLLTSRPRTSIVGTYATCFGVDLASDAGLELAGLMSKVGVTQKWYPIWGAGAARAYERVNALIQEGDSRISLDFAGRLSAREANEYCRKVPLRLAWAEEPAPPGRLMTLVHECFPCPVAAGEHCYTSDETQVLALAMVDIWQPDAVFCGGLRSYFAVANKAAEAGVDLMPHGGGLLPALHTAAILGPLPTIEYHLLLEPRRQVHLTEKIIPDADGMLALPRLPGWHGEPSWELLRK